MCEYQVTDMTKRDILHQGFSVTINKALYRITDVTKRDILHQVCVLDQMRHFTSCFENHIVLNSLKPGILNHLLEIK